jgi:hypothetical protein
MQQESFFHAMAGREGSLLQEFVFPRADGLTPHYLLVNLHRIIQDTTQIFHINKWKPSDLELSYIVEAIQQLNNHLGSIIEDDLLTKEVQANSSLTFRIHLCTTLAMHHVLKQFYLSREASDWVLGEIEAKFNQSLVNTGEMYSTLAAQLIGEPAMQMTLNTFHYAGVSTLQQECDTLGPAAERNHQHCYQDKNAFLPSPSTSSLTLPKRPRACLAGTSSKSWHILHCIL